jgi:hypothetical protein
MPRHLLFPLVCVSALCGLPACGVINNVAAGLDARNYYPDSYDTTKELGREVLATDFAEHRATDLQVSAEGLVVSVEARAICSEEIHYKDTFMTRAGSPLVPEQREWPVGLAAGIGADLVVGGIVVGATGFAAHVNRQTTPAQWDSRRNLILKGVGAVVAVDLVSTAFVLTGLRTNAPRTEHVAQVCSDWDTAARTTQAPSVVVSGSAPWKSGAVDEQTAVFEFPAARLGRALIPARGPVPNGRVGLEILIQGPSLDHIAMTVPTYVRGTDFAPPWQSSMTVDAETVFTYGAAWRCAAMATGWGVETLSAWTPNHHVALMDTLTSTCPDAVEAELGHLCERSTGLSEPEAATWIQEESEQVRTLVARCEQKDLWQKRADSVVTQALKAKQPPLLARLELLYVELFGEAWTQGVAIQRKALSRVLDVAHYEAIMFERRDFDTRPLLDGLTLLDNGTEHLSKSWTSARRREIKTVATADVKAYTKEKSFHSARSIVKKLGEPLGTSWTQQMTSHVDSRERQHVAAEEARERAEYRKCVNLCKRVRLAGDRTTWLCQQAYNPAYCVYYQPSENSCDYGLRGETIMYEPNMPISMAAQIVVGCKN